MASDNGIVLMLHIFDYFVSSSCFFPYAVHLRAKVFRNDYVVAWCFIYIGFEALAKPKHNHKYQFSLHKQSECVRYIASVRTQFLCMCVFFFLHRILNETNKTKEKKIECAHGLLIITHSVVSLFKSNAVCRLVDRSAYPIYYFYLSI